MARNYEKRFSALNRFLEAKQKESKGVEGQPRPQLSRLKSADEVKKWIPSIQREIDYLLRQTTRPQSSRNYTDGKVQEFTDRINDLQREHKRFVAKVQALDPTYSGTIPWQPRAYTRKRPHDTTSKLIKVTGKNGPNCKKLCSPLVEKEEKERMVKLETQLAKKALLSPNLLGLPYSDSESSTEET